MPLLSRKNKPGSGEDAADDGSRSRLFGSKKTQSPATASQNPYAVQNSQPDPYSKPATYGNEKPGYGSQQGGYGGQQGAYNRGGSGYGGMSQQPPAYSSGGYGNMPSGQTRAEKSPVPPGGYGRGGYPNQQSGQQQSGYGAQNPYGSSSYGGSGANGRSSGYGGMGRDNSHGTTNTETGREELFGNAAQRYEQKQNQGLPPSEESSGVENDQGDYGQYRDRQLTAEEEEEEEVQAAKDEIRFIKQQDVSSTRNALRIAEQAEQTGRETLQRLGEQGERIHNTEHQLDLANNQNRAATEKARELKHLNRSMWSVQVNNPFTKTKRKEERDQAVVDKHLYERQQREATRSAAYQTGARHAEQQRELRGPTGAAVKKGNLQERSKYQFEADSEDEAMEDEIDTNLDQLSGAVGRLNTLGKAMGKEVDEQNSHITRIAGKADDVDLGIAMNSARLNRIH